MALVMTWGSLRRFVGFLAGASCSRLSGKDQAETPLQARIQWHVENLANMGRDFVLVSILKHVQR